MGGPAYLASRLAEAGTAAGDAGTGAAHLTKAKLNPLGASAAAGLVAVAGVAGFLLLSDTGDDDNQTAPLARTPSVTAVRESTPPTPSPPSPTPKVTRLVETPTPTPTLTPTPTPTPQVPKAADTTRLRIKSTDQCMETSGNSGAQPREAGCNDTAGQTWELVRNANGHVQLRNQASKLCLTYPDQRPDGAVVRQLACDEDTTTQWWEYYKVESETIAFSLSGDNGRRLGLNDWHAAGKGEPHSSTIGLTVNYYNTTSLVFLFDGELAI